MPPETDNLQLQELFDADQKDRERVYDSPADVKALHERDSSQRKRVYMMMELGEVRTKNDLYCAAVLLQHGDSPADFLGAHRMATLGAIQGHRTCRWLLASSLDRYLMSLGLGQIYQTQFEYNKDDGRYQLRLPVQDQVFLSFEKEFLAVPQASARLGELNERIKKR